MFTTTVSAWYTRGHPGSKTGSVTVIQRASSDLRLNPHFHTLFLDGAYRSDSEDEAVVQRARKRILRYLEKQCVPRIDSCQMGNAPTSGLCIAQRERNQSIRRSSTLRFAARPSSVLLSPTGLSGP